MTNVGQHGLFIPLEPEVFLVAFLITEFGSGEAVLEALSEASGKGGNVQVRVLGVSFKEVEPGVGGDWVCSVENLLDGRARAGRGDDIFDLLVDIDDMCFIIWDTQRGSRRSRGGGFI